jgi:hypothetical protein
MHFICANESNVGDWMSAIGIRRLLGDPPHTLHFCDEYFLPETLPWLSGLGPTDLVVIGGGGLFQEYFVPFWRGVAEVAGRVPYCLWGLGLCGKPEALSTDSTELIRTIAQHARVCAVRDEMTRQFLGLADTTAPVPCPSVVAAQEVPPCDGPRRALLYVVHPDLVSAQNVQCVKSVLLAHALRHGLEYLETDHRTDQGESRQRDSVMSRYASASVVVSSRLHGCILGVAMGCRVIGLASDPKLTAFMHSVGLSDWLCDPGDVEAIAQKLEVLHEQRPPVDSLIAEALIGNRAVAQRVIRIAESLRLDAAGVIR